MSTVTFAELPDHARLWVFAAERPLGPHEANRLLAAVDAFLETWHAHQVPLTCARDWRHDRFLLVGVDEQAAGVSGCSIDALVRTMRALGQDLGVNLLDHAAVFYRAGNQVQRLDRDGFARAAAEGLVSPETTVFDNTVGTIGQLRAGGWERTAATSWHQRAFFA
jgi:hypothetical protein